MTGIMERRIWGRLIASARKEAGISQRDLSRASEISQPTLSRLEKGATNLRVHQLNAINKALDIPRDDLQRQSDKATEIAAEIIFVLRDVFRHNCKTLSSHTRSSRVKEENLLYMAAADLAVGALQAEERHALIIE